MGVVCIHSLTLLHLVVEDDRGGLEHVWLAGTLARPIASLVALSVVEGLTGLLRLIG